MAVPSEGVKTTLVMSSSKLRPAISILLPEEALAIEKLPCKMRYVVSVATAPLGALTPWTVTVAQIGPSLASFVPAMVTSNPVAETAVVLVSTVAVIAVAQEDAIAGILSVLRTDMTKPFPFDRR